MARRMLGAILYIGLTGCGSGGSDGEATEGGTAGSTEMPTTSSPSTSASTSGTIGSSDTTAAESGSEAESASEAGTSNETGDVEDTLDCVTLKGFDGPDVPTNLAGDGYPSVYEGEAAIDIAVGEGLVGNVAPTGSWSVVELNTHPDHWRGAEGGMEHGPAPYPTGERGYNYYDALTRFYVDIFTDAPPATFLIDEVEFCRDPNPENDAQIYAFVATYVPESNRVVVTWDRHKDENEVVHEVRYAFEDIHAIGWDAAMSAPDGTLVPPGDQGYNNGLRQHGAPARRRVAAVHRGQARQRGRVLADRNPALSGRLATPWVDGLPSRA
jgi:hypothetical protein